MSEPVSRCKKCNLVQFYREHNPFCRKCKAALELVVTVVIKEVLVEKQVLVPCEYCPTCQFKGGFPSFADIESMMITEALRVCENNVLAAAKLLGVGKTTLYRKIKAGTVCNVT